MTFSEALKKLETAIRLEYKDVNTTFPALELLTAITGKSKTALLSCLREKLTKVEEKRLGNLLARIAKKEPVQYIIGSSHFYGNKFRVTKNTLIPRPETEELVEASIAFLSELVEQNNTILEHKLNAIDIGTGSGAIIISIANTVKQQFNKTELFEFYATDISERAILIAKQNAKSLPITFVKTKKADFFPPRLASEKFDLITANLPYLSEAEYTTLPQHIIRYEPKSALLGGKTGTEIVEALLSHLPHKLTPQGIALIELPPIHRTWLEYTCKKQHLKVKKVGNLGFVWSISLKQRQKQDLLFNSLESRTLNTKFWI